MKTLASILVASLVLAGSSVALAEPLDQPPPSDGEVEHKAAPVNVGAYASAGFPSLMSVGAMVWFERTVSLGGEYGFLPFSRVSDVDVQYRSLALDLRVFPLQSPFFVGLRAGQQHASAATTLSAAPYGSYTVTADADTWFLNPRIGFLWTTSFGLTVGMDAGVRIPTSHKTSNNLPAGVAMPGSVSSVTDLLAAKVIPTVTLLQLGMQF